MDEGLLTVGKEYETKSELLPGTPVEVFGRSGKVGMRSVRHQHQGVEESEEELAVCAARLEAVSGLLRSTY